jgi:hypothetical protein
MLIRQEDIQAINFEGLLIHDFTAGQATTASFAAIEVPAGIWHREAWSQRSDKYYYVVSGQLCFTLDGVEHLWSQGSFCRGGRDGNFHTTTKVLIQSSSSWCTSPVSS